MRCLGIDYGTKRIGLAYGEDLGVATPLPALVHPDARERWSGLDAAIRQRRITDLVLGCPYNMDGTEGPKAREAQALAARLRTDYGLPVHLVDETLTSSEAESTLPRKNLRALRPTGTVDSRAACLILQDFLDRAFPSPPLPPPAETDGNDSRA